VKQLAGREATLSKSAKIDQNGRLKIPADLLVVFKESGAEFFITSEDGESVRIYPLQSWKEIEKRLMRLCLHSRSMRNLLTRTKYFGQAVTIDKQGRVLIPAILREAAQMKGEVDVLDYRNYLEVWNHARLMNNLNCSPLTVQDENSLTGWRAELENWLG
jgi:MraZ protein